MSNSIGDILSNLEEFQRNPAATQRYILNMLQEVTDGAVEVVDASNPFIFLLEAATLTAANAMAFDETLNREQYPALAQSWEELYRHMSDIDYSARFVTPARTSFMVLLSTAEIKSRAVAETTTADSTDTTSIVRKITIPRNTMFTISDMAFSLQYPIDIRVMPHGGFQVLYDTAETSPLETLESNVPDWEVVTYEGISFLALTIPVKQFKINDYYDSLTPSSGFNRKYEFADQFYYCRAYLDNNDQNWVEILTTHSDQVFDPTQPTVCLKVLDNNILEASIPPIYFTNGLLTDKRLRLDIYTSKGPIERDLQTMKANSTVAEWLDIATSSTTSSTTSKNVFTAPLTVFNQLGVYIAAAITGGVDGLTFDEQRSRVINHANATDLPITDAQLAAKLEDRGYSLVKSIDNITDRVYLATRQLPVQTNKTIGSGAGCTMDTIQANMTTLAGYSTVMDNGSRLTITPDALYLNKNGVTTILDDIALGKFVNPTVEYLAALINNNTYLYTPFHYVLDATGTTFACRGYYMDAPEVKSKAFVDYNPTTQLSVSTGGYKVLRTAKGYQLVVTTSSGDEFKALDNDQVHAQLGFIPNGESDYAYLNGVYQGLDSSGERIFAFDIDTVFDINASDELYVTSFSMLGNAPSRFLVSLLQTIQIFYAVSNYTVPKLEFSDIDAVLGKDYLPAGVYAVNQEALRVRFGHALEGLWSRSRSVASNITYLTYTEDVPYTYDQTVYKRDPQTGAIEITMDGNNQPVYTVLHQKGDPVMDTEGNPAYRYRKGDVKTDAKGDPIPANQLDVMRQFDLFLIDATYRYSTDTADINYREQLAATVVSWLEDDIAYLSKSMLERTKLYYYPKQTIGTVDVLTGAKEQVSIPAALSFTVKHYLTTVGYNNADLRAALATTTSEVINKVLKQATVSVTDMSSRLKALTGDDVLSSVVLDFGPNGDIDTFTAVDDGKRCTVRKVLDVLPDNTLSVKEDITIDPIRLTTN